jgi:transcriptional regulator with XRE-family HTH domain
MGMSPRVLPVGRFETRRRELGLTQAALAERAGIDRAQVSRIEHGLIPSLDAQRRLARALAIDVDTLWPLVELCGDVEDV